MTEEQLTRIFNQQLAVFFGQVNKRFDELETKVDTKADGERVYKALDGIAKRLDTDEGERSAIAAQVNRHEGWIDQLASATGSKLQTEK